MTEVEYLAWLHNFIERYTTEIIDYHSMRYPDDNSVDDLLKRISSEKWRDGNINMAYDVMTELEERIAELTNTPGPYKQAVMRVNLDKLLKERYATEV